MFHPIENCCIYLCNAYPKCDAKVGCHPRTIIALGTLANKELRRWRILAHQKFDPLWQSGVFSNRQAAYKWLSKAMRLPLGKPMWQCLISGSVKGRSRLLRFLPEVGGTQIKK